MLQRVNQSYFRNSLLQNYHGTCCITGMQIPKLLIASHIKPWKASTPNEKTAASNGLLLNAFHDRAFDQGLISIDDDYRIMVNHDKVRHSDINDRWLYDFDGHEISLPAISQPSHEFIEYHHKHIFLANAAYQHRGGPPPRPTPRCTRVSAKFLPHHFPKPARHNLRLPCYTNYPFRPVAARRRSGDLSGQALKRQSKNVEIEPETASRHRNLCRGGADRFPKPSAPPFPCFAAIDYSDGFGRFTTRTPLRCTVYAPPSLPRSARNRTIGSPAMPRSSTSDLPRVR